MRSWDWIAVSAPQSFCIYIIYIAYLSIKLLIWSRYNTFLTLILSGLQRPFTTHTYLHYDTTITITYQYKFVQFCKCFDTFNWCLIFTEMTLIMSYPIKYSFQYKLQIKIINYIGIKDQSTIANVKIDINRVY